MDRINGGIEALSKVLSDSREAASDAEHAIMTTDTVPKEIAVKTVIGGKEVTIGGMSKGSGMIHPNMYGSKEVAFRGCIKALGHDWHDS